MNATFARYFSEYLGADLAHVNAGGIVVAGSTRRLQPEYGWGYTVAAWLFRLDDATVISVQPALVEPIQHAFAGFPVTEISNLDAIIQALEPAIAGLKTRRQFIYTTSNTRIRHIDAPAAVRRMAMRDIAAFLDMSRAFFPDIDVECQITDITRNIADGVAYAAFVNEQMVSRCHTPHIAHMQDRVEEISIETLEAHRNRGYASAALAGTTFATLAISRLPIYRVSIYNEPSIRTVERVGYQRVAESVEWVA